MSFLLLSDFLWLLISLLKNLSAFGFCEYSTPESALRAIRLLHDMEVGEKKLVVKVDAKTKIILDNYKGITIYQMCVFNRHRINFCLKCYTAEKVKSSGTAATNGDDDYLTQETRVQDKWVKERIGQTIKDYESEMQANQARGKAAGFLKNKNISERNFLLFFFI